LIHRVCFYSHLLETCDLQLFNEILTILLDKLKRKPSSAVANKKSASSEANTTSKSEEETKKANRILFSYY